MKGLFRAEAIGYGNYNAVRDYSRRPAGDHPPWLAEITGLSAKYGLAREFLHPKVDWSQSNSSANRGVFFCWTLEAGKVYQANYWTSWTRQVREFLKVADDGTVVEITREEVDAWLARELNVARIEPV